MRQNQTARKQQRIPFSFRAKVGDHTGVFTAGEISVWDKHSGKDLDGTPVHSLDVGVIGDTSVIRKPDGKKFAVRSRDLRVLAIGILTQAGCTVTGPDGTILNNA